MTDARMNLLETTYARDILRGLQRKPVFQGSVPEGVVDQRRAANRRARAARRINRHS